jgi:hypothetical protein
VRWGEITLEHGFDVRLYRSSMDWRQQRGVIRGIFSGEATGTEMQGQLEGLELGQ